MFRLFVTTNVVLMISGKSGSVVMRSKSKSGRRGALAAGRLVALRGTRLTWRELTPMWTPMSAPAVDTHLLGCRLPLVRHLPLNSNGSELMAIRATPLIRKMAAEWHRFAWNQVEATVTSGPACHSTTVWQWMSSTEWHWMPWHFFTAADSIASDYVQLVNLERTWPWTRHPIAFSFSIETFLLAVPLCLAGHWMINQ